MRTPRIVEAMNYIDDDLVSWAITYKRKRKMSSWAKWCVAAACFCLVVFGVWTVTNTNEPVYGVFAEIIEIHDNEQYVVKITGGDQNFAKEDIVIINYDYVNSDYKRTELKIGDIIAITYSKYKKSGIVYEITTGQIGIVQSNSK